MATIQTTNSMIQNNNNNNENQQQQQTTNTIVKPQLPPGLKPLPFNYFPPGSTSGGGAAQPLQNPLLSNGLPTLPPNLAALRPPSNITLPKLTTNFNSAALQPPPSLQKPVLSINSAALTPPPASSSSTNTQNVLLNNPLLQNQLPKFTPPPLIRSSLPTQQQPTAPTAIAQPPPPPQTVQLNHQQPEPDSSLLNDDSLNNDANQSLASNGTTATSTTATTTTTSSSSSNGDNTGDLNSSAGFSTQAQQPVAENNNLFNSSLPQSFQSPNSFPPVVQLQNQANSFTQPPVATTLNQQSQLRPTLFPSNNQQQTSVSPAPASTFTPPITSPQQQPPPRFGTMTGPPQTTAAPTTMQLQTGAPPLPQQQPQFFSPSPIRPSIYNGPQNPSPLSQQQLPRPSFGPPTTATQPPTFNQQPGFSAPPTGPSTFSQPGPPQAATAPPTGPSTFSQPPQTGTAPSTFGAPPPTFGAQPVPQTAPPSFLQPNMNAPPPTFSQPSPSAGPPLSTGAAVRPPTTFNRYPTPSTNVTNQQPQSNGPYQTMPPPSNTQQQQQQQQRPPSALPSSTTSQQQLVNQFNQMQVKGGQKPLALDLLQEKRLIPPYDENTELIRPKFPHEFYTNVNCHPDIVRSTLTAMPESQNLLTKCRLPLGLLIHPFKDLESLKVVQSATIVRCRNCRSYINPFVHFLDNTKWRCNLCYSVNDLPDEFLFDPVTRTYGDPSKRPEINSSTIEFIAPAEYTLRPPPPAMYLFLLDVSHNAINTGYLQNACEILLECLDKLPGDTRTQIGFITYNSCIHFYNLSDSLSQPQMMIYPDLDDVSLPLPENLMINLNENKESIQTFLQDLPNLFHDTYDTENALGTALTAAFKLLTSTGGRITIMQTCMPTCGVGSLKHRSDSIEKDAHAFAPQTDFYKKLALECAGIHIAVDLFMFNALYADLATLSCISKYSGGEIKYYPEFHLERYPEQSDRFCFDFKRYLTRKIGFEAVMRIRCTRGISIHTFHGNFFVRSTDLLALPNVNPDAGFGMQISIDETLSDVSTVCFQAALLYTSSKGERRIRIHTYCLPVSNNLTDLINGADQEAVIGLVAKMAVDRTVMSSIKEAKDAMANVAIDYLNAYTQMMTKQSKGSLLTPYSLRLVPLYVLALMKSIAFKYNSNIKIDDRIYMMNVFKAMPLKYLLLYLYPHLYAVHNIDDTKTIVDSETEICIPPRLHLSSESIDRHGVYILDVCESIYMWVGRSVNDQFLQQVFNVKSFNELPDHMSELPELDNVLSERIRNFIVYLYDQRPFGASFLFFREDSVKSQLFFQHIHEDKTESTVSYMEFVRYLNDQVNKG